MPVSNSAASISSNHLNQRAPKKTYVYLNGQEVNEHILLTYEEEKKGRSIKRFVTQQEQKIQIYTKSEYKHNRLILNGRQIIDLGVLATHTTEGNGNRTKHYVVIDNQKTQVFTADQLFHKRLFLNGQQIINADVLATYTSEGKGNQTKHYVTIENQKMQVFTAAQLSGQRLFLNGQQITDADVIATHTSEGNGNQIKHYVMIENQKIQVFTAAQLSGQRLFLNGQQIIDADVLATHTSEGKGSQTKHYVMIENRKEQVFTADSVSKNRLFWPNGELITDKDILNTHEKNKLNKHFVTWQGNQQEVYTYRQLQKRGITPIYSNNWMSVSQAAQFDVDVGPLSSLAHANLLEPSFDHSDIDGECDDLPDVLVTALTNQVGFVSDNPHRQEKIAQPFEITDLPEDVLSAIASSTVNTENNLFKTQKPSSERGGYNLSFFSVPEKRNRAQAQLLEETYGDEGTDETSYTKKR
ncbi:hypothetical protein ACQUW5_02555 [Legionella sp. CNM-1927-20]|uniref:hypothetical protein n=1 Tax=Legionella sp. CNM-1927-20 TaxID=3422221 RepID=UPI00403AE269